MSMKILISDFPDRSVAIATDGHALIFRYANVQDANQHTGATGLSLRHVESHTSTPRCMVEFIPLPAKDLSSYRNVGAARGTLGLITLNGDVFLAVVTGSLEVATLRPGETVQRIYAVEFYCINRSDHDHSHGFASGQNLAADDLDYPSSSSGYDTSDSAAEHPFHALQKLLSSGSFYYSQDFDLTRRLQDRGDSAGVVDISRLDEGLLWNSYMIHPLLEFRRRLTQIERNDLDDSRILTSVIRGFARTISIAPSTSPIQFKKSSQPSTLTVISRLSSRRAGTRFNSRGIDDNGNVANFVETETVFWSPSGLCFSYTQVRGSVPIFWESSSSLIPGQQKINITRSPEATQPSFDKHFAGLEHAYGAIHVLNLLSNSRPGELELTQRYRYHLDNNPLTVHGAAAAADHHDLLTATHFDFNSHTQGAAGYEGAQAIKPFILDSAEAFVYFLSQDMEEWISDRGKAKLIQRPAVIMQQNGVFRVNCLDCLDRTNLVQSMISRMALENFLAHRAERGNADFWMRHSTLWADNGDALSRIYAGTGALKSSFTRHGKMSLAGALADARKSATRLYVNHFEDKNRQNTIDLLLGRLVGQSSVELFDPINDWVVAELGKRRADFESRGTVNVFVGSYNLNGQATGSSENLTAWFHPQADNFGIVVVGFQEIVELSPQQIMSTDPNRRMVWESAVRSCLNRHLVEKDDGGGGGGGDHEPDHYVLLRSGQLVGSALLIFVKSSLLDRITNVEGAIKKTGLSGMAGNKGAVAIRMEIDSTSVCFVTAHLAAGFANYDERNRDYDTITSGLRFQRDRMIDDHEVIIWAGDFNYRIGLSYDHARALVAAAAAGGPKADVALEKLYENDQLNIQMVAGNCFPFYREGKVAFLPTYKFDLGRDEYDSSDKQRIPAWTDRIVYKVNHDRLVHGGGGGGGGGGDDLGTRLKQLEYASVMDLRFSDHRPVYATFQLGVRVVDVARRDELTKRLYKRRAREVKARADDDDDDDDDSEIEEEVTGYNSIQEGLPPASSDRRKWWLDEQKGAASQLAPPGPNMRLNPRRSGNPWRDGADEEDWVRVERPTSPSRSAAVGSVKPKPQPPPARRKAKAEEPSTTNAGPVRSPSAASVARKAPPPKPAKPVALTLAGGQTSAAATTTAAAAESAQPPPLPARTATTAGDAVTRATAAGIISLQHTASFPAAAPPPPRSVAKLSHGGGRERASSVSSDGSAARLNRATAPTGADGRQREQRPSLPPRRRQTDTGLLDRDDDEMDAVAWKAIVPGR